MPLFFPQGLGNLLTLWPVIIILQYTELEYVKSSVPWNVLFGVAALMIGKDAVFQYEWSEIAIYQYVNAEYKGKTFINKGEGVTLLNCVMRRY